MHRLLLRREQRDRRFHRATNVDAAALQAVRLM
jgi:hypothetical protein